MEEGSCVQPGHPDGIIKKGVSSAGRPTPSSFPFSSRYCQQLISVCEARHSPRGCQFTIYSFFDDLTASIVTYYAEQRPSSGYVTFGTTNDTVPAKIRITKRNIARDPWAIGSVPMPPAVPVLRAIKDCLAVSSTFVLERKWIMHPKPRLILLDGIEIQQQLSGKEQLSHEMCAAIFRRLSQMDKTYSKDTLTMFWRKFLEPDFATAVLSNADPLTIQSIRATFTEENENFSPASSRMWHIPALLPDGWAVYAFDMARRRILVLDPAIGPFGLAIEGSTCTHMCLTCFTLHSSDASNLYMIPGTAVPENGPVHFL
ncbi:uncharacterized protein [Triticum aestivum]|uniref:uncharacterized protein n=1 Tax=Triticum aestivum TaxID=4565 RepID=UPI001D023EEE|nr:uncharacterized protein LOC123123373 [Triticum aestivum]XP_044399811.1 uncharacterized protein LOC123123373 [Triticum aestivum]XP_044399812.1 uncharacterized protein LOC123123373 [Triticum aestivum]